jgi:hypothetical protein
MSEPVEVDFDLLADYVGGALDGTSEQERAAALVATDPGWAREHELLVAALAATADDLATFAEQTAEPMPDEVLARLLTSLPEPAATSAVPAGARGGPARGSRTPVRRRPEAGPRPPGRARRRPRWRSWAAPALVAVAVAAFAGVWINQSVGTGTTANDSAAGAPMTQTQERSAGGDALALPRFASGRDYTSADVAGGFGTRTSSRATDAPEVMSGDAGTPGGAKAAAIDPELLRLNGDAALAVCVRAVERALGQGPIMVSATDFASYQGQPAVLIFFTDSSGVRWGWAVGPDCGPAGTDDLIRVRVG